MRSRVACAGLALLALACGGHDHTPLPADVEAVFAAKCWGCHGDPPAFGAPMPLVVWEDTQGGAPTDRSRKVWELVEERVHDAARPMPPPGTGSLAAAELAVLDAWFAAGAPPGDRLPQASPRNAWEIPATRESPAPAVSRVGLNRW